MYDSSDSLDTPWYRSQSHSRLPANGAGTHSGGPGPRSEGPSSGSKARSRLVGLCVLFATLLDLLILFGLGILEYFMRCSPTLELYADSSVQELCRYVWRDVLPLRRRSYSCSDNQLNYSSTDVPEFDSFPFKADISETLVYCLCFIVPISVFLICELFLLCLMYNRTKDVNFGLCPGVKMPQVIRRIYRFIVTYLFGIFALMIFIEIVKIFVGQLRPTFYQACEPRCQTISSTDSSNRFSDSFCKIQDVLVLKEARTSFPSMQSALTMYAAVTITIYLHGINKIHHSRFICTPLICLTVILLSVCWGLVRLGRNHNWWTDIVVGFGLGATMSAYLNIIVLRAFNFQESTSNRKLSRQLGHALSVDRTRDNRDTYRESCFTGTRSKTVTYDPINDSTQPTLRNGGLVRSHLRAHNPIYIPNTIANLTGLNTAMRRTEIPIMVSGPTAPPVPYLDPSLLYSDQQHRSSSFNQHQGDGGNSSNYNPDNFRHSSNSADAYVGELHQRLSDSRERGIEDTVHSRQEDYIPMQRF